MGFTPTAAATEPSPWWLAQNKHFEVYSHVSGQNARNLLDRFERLRVFWIDASIPGLSGLLTESGVPLRVVEFNSQAEYSEYRTHTAADAYYVSTDAGEYIVLPPAASLGVTAHEYAHAMLHARALQLPDWLAEGLAEVFSTVRFTNSGFTFGGDLPSRADTLRRHPRMPISELLNGSGGESSRESREIAGIFYAESWALADMLLSSPEYGHLDRFFAALSAGGSAQKAFETVYRKPLNVVGQDLQTWISGRRSTARFIPEPDVAPQTIVPVRVSDVRAGMVLADLLVANEEWNRAEEEYRELLRAYPNDPKLLAGVGTLALRSGKQTVALENWRKAIESGASDPGLCYRFALLADDAHLPENEIALALEKAIAAKPDFDDARYRLAILESNRANYQAAVAQLKAMQVPSGSRAYAYWSALAASLSELGRTEEATAAAKQAVLNARTPDERGIAAALEYTTKTDFHVQLQPDADGQMKAVTIRTPHGFDWNPFIEAGDQIERTEGELRSVQCSGGRLAGFTVDTKAGQLQLGVPDPTHVQMRNSPAEFSCGAQSPRTVKVEYAKATAKQGAILRGMEFR